MSRVPLNPVARPVDTFAPRELRVDQGKGDQLMQLATSLKSLVPEMAQFAKNYIETKNIQGMAQAQSDMINLKIKNQEDLNAAVASGKIKPEDNPWRMNYLNQLTAREEFRGYMRSMSDQYSKDNNLKSQNNLDSISQWMDEGFEKFIKNKAPDQVLAIAPMMNDFKNDFLQVHKRMRDAEHKTQMTQAFQSEMLQAKDNESSKMLIQNAFLHGMTPSEMRPLIISSVINKNSENGGNLSPEEITKQVNELLGTSVDGKQIFDEIDIVDPVTNQVTKSGKFISDAEGKEISNEAVKAYINNESLTERLNEDKNRKLNDQIMIAIGSGMSFSQIETAFGDLPADVKVRVLQTLDYLKAHEGEEKAQKIAGDLAAILLDPKATEDQKKSAKLSSAKALIAMNFPLDKAAQMFNSIDSVVKDVGSKDERSPAYFEIFDSINDNSLNWDQLVRKTMVMSHEGSITPHERDVLLGYYSTLQKNESTESGTAKNQIVKMISERAIETTFVQNGFFKLIDKFDVGKNQNIKVFDEESSFKLYQFDLDRTVWLNDYNQKNPDASLDELRKDFQAWVLDYAKITAPDVVAPKPESLPISLNNYINDDGNVDFRKTNVDGITFKVEEDGSVYTYDSDNNKRPMDKSQRFWSDFEDYDDRKKVIWTRLGFVKDDDTSRKLKYSFLAKFVDEHPELPEDEKKDFREEAQKIRLGNAYPAFDTYRSYISKETKDKSDRLNKWNSWYDSLSSGVAYINYQNKKDTDTALSPNFKIVYGDGRPDLISNIYNPGDEKMHFADFIEMQKKLGNKVYFYLHTQWRDYIRGPQPLEAPTKKQLQTMQAEINALIAKSARLNDFNEEELSNAVKFVEQGGE